MNEQETIETALNNEIKRLQMLVREEIVRNKEYKEKVRKLELQLESTTKIAQ